MANDQNIYTFSGRLGADPEIRHTSSGKAVANLRLVVNRSWTKDDGKTWEEKATWWRCVAWDRLAERVKDLQKGDRISAVGSIEDTDPWTDKDGRERVDKEIRLTLCNKLDRDFGFNRQNNNEPPTREEAAKEAVREKVMGGPGVPEDDIPF